MFNYDNIGEKIKGLAKFFFISGTILSILLGLFMLQNNTIRAILIIVLGTIGSWLSSLTLYGFGEIIVKLTQIENNTRPHSDANETPASLVAASGTDSLKGLSREEIKEKKLKGEIKNCPYCGWEVTSSKCDTCGKTNKLFDT